MRYLFELLGALTLFLLALAAIGELFARLGVYP